MKLNEAEKNTNAKDLANALKGILKNRGRKADSIASYDILDALDTAGLKLEKARAAAEGSQ